MKKYIAIVLCVILLSMKSDDDRKTLLCHKWQLFAYKQSNASSTITIDKSHASEFLFKADGTYKEVTMITDSR
jgi:hypothetical protein